MCLHPITDDPQGQQRPHVIFPGGVRLVSRVQFRVKLFGLIHGKMADGFSSPATGKARKLFCASLLDNDSAP
jgi:hypothetical protein